MRGGRVKDCSTDSSAEAPAVSQKTDDTGLEEKDGNGSGEKWSEAGYSFRAAFLVDWKWNAETGRNPEYHLE